MNELYVDIGWKSILHHGEELCGDHVEVAEASGGDKIVVLADGLGSGVKASILSTLTSRIISTMMAQGMPLEECISAVIAALPVDAAKGVAYSTFTVIRIINCTDAEIFQYENPGVILLRGVNQYDFPQTKLTIAGKTVIKSTVRLREGDVFIAMSDGCTNASAVRTYSYTWTKADIADYMKVFAPVGYTAKTLATMLADECFRRYNEQPLDDATACVICLRPRKNINLLFGPPQDPADDAAVLQAFFSAPGKHVVCGGTTAKLAAAYLGKPIKPLNSPSDTGVPPISGLEGVDLVTEGVITMHRVQEYVSDNLADNKRYTEWSAGRDGACLITRMLLEEGTDFHFFVGRAANPAYQNPDLPADLHLKMSIVKQLASALRSMAKRVKVSYY